MKKLLSFLSVLCIAFVIADTSYSQYGGDEARNKDAESKSCTYTCWYKEGDHWTYINKIGLYTDCVKVDYTSSCQETACEPVNPC